MAIQEAYVKVTEEIIRAASLNGLGSDLICAGVIVSDIGNPYPTIVTTRSQLLKEYTINGTLSPTDHTTLLNAYRLLGSSAMLIVRSVNSVWASMVDSDDNTGYFYNTYSKKFTKFSTDLEFTCIAAITTFSGDGHVVIGNYCLYKGTAPSIPGKLMIELSSGDSILKDLHNYNDRFSDMFIERVSTSAMTATGNKTKYTIRSVNAIESTIVTSFTATAATSATTDIDLITTNNPSFLIIPKSLSATPYIEIEIKDIEGILDHEEFIISFDGTDYNVSMERDKLDEYGRSI